MSLIRKVSLQHPLKGIKTRKHGEEQRVEVASHGAAVLRPGHLDLGIVFDDLPCARLMLEADELSSFLDIPSCCFT